MCVWVGGCACVWGWVRVRVGVSVLMWDPGVVARGCGKGQLFSLISDISQLVEQRLLP